MPSTIAALRQRIQRLERGGSPARQAVLSFGQAALDGHLPGGGLPLACLHEVSAAEPGWGDGFAVGFCAALLLRLTRAKAPIAPREVKSPGVGAPAPKAAMSQAAISKAPTSKTPPVLWLAPRPDLYAPGLAAFGFDPDRLILLSAGNDRDLLWALEEALRCRGLAAVVGEVAGLDLTASRRLQLAAEAGGVTGFLLRRPLPPGRLGEGSSAAVTRWRLAPAPSSSAFQTQATSLPFIGRARWRAELLRCRGGAPASFLVEWDHAAGDFALAAPLRDGPLAAPANTGSTGAGSTGAGSTSGKPAGGGSTGLEPAAPSRLRQAG